MPRQRPDPDGYFVSRSSRTYNVRCKGNIVFNRITKRNLKELQIEIIESVWVVEERRQLTRTEILRLCAVKQ